MKKKILILVAVIATFIAMPLMADVNKQNPKNASWSIKKTAPAFLLAKNNKKQTNLFKNSAGYTDINASTLSEMMLNKGFTLVNVHIPYEGELPQTDLFIPFNRITKSENLKKLPDKDSPIVLYCRSGSMSTSAAKELAELGYTDIFELDGGFNAWKAEGYNLIKK